MAGRVPEAANKVLKGAKRVPMWWRGLFKVMESVSEFMEPRKPEVLGMRVILPSQ